jgi:hypothetical protein
MCLLSSVSDVSGPMSPSPSPSPPPPPPQADVPSVSGSKCVLCCVWEQRV